MKKNLITKLFAAIVLFFNMLVLSSCDFLENNTNDVDSQIYSIYQIYTEAGGNLTYDEWFSSIINKPGKDGVDGVNGADGKDGVDGVNGADGKDGLTPYIGINGNWWIGEYDTNVYAGDKNEQIKYIYAQNVYQV